MKIELITKINGYPDYSITSDGQVINTRTGRILKQGDSNGYHIVGLYKDGKPKCYSVHRLLALAFIPNPENYPQIDHIDHNRANNQLENLRWVSREMNQQNRSKQKGISSQWMGVCWKKTHKKWVATIYSNGKYKHLGCFTDELEAARAYNKAATARGFKHINNLEALELEPQLN